MQAYSKPGKHTIFLTESEIVDTFTKATGESSAVCYCKDCGCFLVHDEKIWHKTKTPWAEMSMPLVCTNANKTFLHVKNYNGHEYRRCVCDDCIKKKFPNYKGMLTCQSAFYVQYAFGVSDEDFKGVKDKVCKRTEENYIQLFGKEEGLRRWNLYKRKQAVSNTFEYKQKKHGWSKEQFDEYNKSRAVTLENLINRHGKEKGDAIWKSYCDKQRYTTSKEYFIETYGETDGLLKWEAYNDAHYMFGGASEISQECFDKIAKYFPDNDICYANRLGEKSINGYRLDYYDATLNVVIEFHGDYWHMNPNKYLSADRNLNRNKTAEEIWNHDADRRAAIEQALSGCLYIVIWESDYRRNPEGAVQIVLSEISYFIKHKSKLK